ncbi:MAG: hypothetical protein HGB10_02810 [Coriobacteriia bacterium]|nr:hypothetical protein [Coriobacteriia bacterium]
MDGAAVQTAAAPGGIIGWVMQYGNVVFFFAQVAYWFFMVLFIGYAVAQFKRWVNFQLGTGASGQLRDAAAADVDEDEDDDDAGEDSRDSKSEVSIEEFVD